MKQSLLLFLIAFLACSTLHAQDTTYWKRSMNFGVNFNQSSFSDNWKAGGVNSVALGGLFNYKAGYLRNKTSWDTEIDLLYGVVKNAGQSTRKNADRILFDTKFGHQIGAGKWAAYGSFNFLTQFAPGYRYSTNAQGQEVSDLISQFLAPAFITTALGFEYKPNKEFWLRLSPFSPRITIVNDTTIYLNVPENYGVEIGETVRYEWLAFSAIANYDKNLNENMNLKLRYQLFANLETLGFKELDQRMDVVLTAKVAKYVNVNFTGILLYDRDQDVNVQLSQGLALGLLFTMKK